MTEDQGAQLIALLQQQQATMQDLATQVHTLDGVLQFVAHVLAGLFFLVIFFGIVQSSQLRRRGS